MAAETEPVGTAPASSFSPATEPGRVDGSAAARADRRATALVAAAASGLTAELLSPAAERARSREPLRVRIGVPAGAHAAVPRLDADDGRRVLAIDPPTAGRFGFEAPDVLWFEPRTWLAGRLYRVTLVGHTGAGDVVAPRELVFRTRVPRPRRIEPGRGSNVILCFDDGPGHGREADELLELLAREHVRALFFATSDWTRLRPRWVARARRDGHALCNHTVSHPDLRAASDEALQSEMAGGHGLETEPGRCTLFRPPMRAYDERVVRVAHELGFRLLLWHVDTRDWEGFGEEDIENRVLGEVRPGSVVLFHIQAGASLRALPSILARLRAAGYVPSYDPADVAEGRFSVLTDVPDDLLGAGMPQGRLAGRWWLAPP